MKRLCLLVLLALLGAAGAAEPVRVLVLGMPGTGKSLHVRRLAQERKLYHVAGRDLVREQVHAGTPLGKRAATFLKAGQAVPDEIQVAMVKEQLDAHPDFVLDDFPRTVAQARLLNAALSQPFTQVIRLTVPDDLGCQRLTARRYCPKCQRTYYFMGQNVPRQENRCDVDHTVLQQREDDREAAARERIRLYHEQTEPVAQVYGELIKTVDASPDLAQVQAELLRLVP